MHRRRAIRDSATRQIGAGAETFAQFIGEETNGGKLLLAATTLALVWANVAGEPPSGTRTPAWGPTGCSCT